MCLPCSRLALESRLLGTRISRLRHQESTARFIRTSGVSSYMFFYPSFKASSSTLLSELPIEYLVIMEKMAEIADANFIPVSTLTLLSMYTSFQMTR